MPINEDPNDLSLLNKARLNFREDMKELGNDMKVEELEMMSKALSQDGTEVYYDGDAGMPATLTPEEQRRMDRDNKEPQDIEKKG